MKNTTNVPWIIAILTVIAMVVGVFQSPSNNAAPQKAVSTSTTEVLDAEKAIVTKLSPHRVSSKFTPVALYRVEKDRSFFSGSGSLFIGKNEGTQIITSEHLLRRELGKATFGYRILCPLEEAITHGVESVLHKGTEMSPLSGGTPDVVILKSGDPKEITCFSKHNIVPSTETLEVTSLLKPFTLKSIATGETARVLGFAKHEKDKAEYVVLEYESFNGQSGTGFVDKDENLYVLKGILDITGESLKNTQRLLKTERPLSIAAGPFAFGK